MRMYAREHDFSNEQMYGFKRVSSGVCKRKGHNELFAAEKFPKREVS